MTTIYIAQNVYWRGTDEESSEPDYLNSEWLSFDEAAAHAASLVGQPAPPDAIPGGVFEPHYDVTEYDVISPVENVPIRRWIFEGDRVDEIVEGADL